MRIGRRTRLESIVFDFDGTLAELRIDFSQMKERLGLLAGDYLPFAPRPTLLPALEWIDELAADIHRTDGTAASEFQERASTSSWKWSSKPPAKVLFSLLPAAC